MLRDGPAAGFLFQWFQNFAWRSNRQWALRHVAGIHRSRGHHTQAFDVHLHLLREWQGVGDCLRAIALESHLADRPLYRYYRANRSGLRTDLALLLDCFYAQKTEEVLVDWEAVRESIQQEFRFPLVRNALLAALIRDEMDFVTWVESLALSGMSVDKRDSFHRIFCTIAICYYRRGRIEALNALSRRVSLPGASWGLYEAFGQREPMRAMVCRAMTLRDRVICLYPDTPSRQGRRVLVPEKDLCGEAFNSLFYESVRDEEGGFVVACDARLHNILRSSFPGIDFVAKTPRYLCHARPADFDLLPPGVRDFLDNDSFAATSGGELFMIDYPRYFDTPRVRTCRASGWLRTDPALKDRWQRDLAAFSGKTLIGFSANSTLRSGMRDFHMVPIECWDALFSLTDCVFVNLNPSFSAESCVALSKRFGIEVLHPDFDLFNDFDSLLALMSVLDHAVVPANSLMDFAAAVGLSSIVFSPSGIMRGWVADDDRYVFSERVRFVFRESPDEAMEDMVGRGADLIAGRS
jgi:hypothetical protein